MSIPIQNLYYLLSYAWDRLDEKDMVQVDATTCATIQDLCARVLINATRMLVRRGIEKNYVSKTEDLPGVKGKANISDTVKRDLLRRGKAACSFDEFSADILANRILLTTLRNLLRTRNLDATLKTQILPVVRMLSDIRPIQITDSLFAQVRLHRNNRFYGFILNVCQLVHTNTLPTEDPGTLRFKDFTRDEAQMNRLFEAFLRNFYRREQSTYPTVRSEIIHWHFTAADSTSESYLPQMKTDITLENDTQKIILDAKYYRDTLSTHYEQDRLHSANLYQLFSYLLNQHSAEQKTFETRGILVYPQTDKHHDLRFQYHEHTIEIRTVDLNQDWKQIEQRLLAIIDFAPVAT